MVYSCSRMPYTAVKINKTLECNYKWIIYIMLKEDTKEYTEHDTF